MARKKTTKNFAKIVRAKLVADPELAKAVERERLHADVAEQVLQLRAEAGLTQKQVAELIDTKQSVISRIEDADYHGHSLSMLQRIADVFNKRLFVVFANPGYTPTLYGRAVGATNTTAEINLSSALVTLGHPAQNEEASHGTYIPGTSSDNGVVMRFPENFPGNALSVQFGNLAISLKR